MMRRSIATFVLVAMLPSTAVAEEQEGVVYFQLDGGQARFADSEIDRLDVTFDAGWSVNGRIGAEMEHVALELELGLHGANYEPVGDGYSPAIFVTAGVNLIFKFLRLPGLDAYGGLGFGYLSDDPPISAVQFNAHAESGLIMRLNRHAQLVPHIRTMIIFGASEDDIGRSQSYDQVISTARLGVRFTP